MASINIKVKFKFKFNFISSYMRSLTTLQKKTNNTMFNLQGYCKVRIFLFLKHAYMFRRFKIFVKIYIYMYLQLLCFTTSIFLMYH